MKNDRHAKIIDIIQKNHIETQEELSDYLAQEGYVVTQATISRDIRNLSLNKINDPKTGRPYYTVMQEHSKEHSAKLNRVLREAYISMDFGENIIVIRTVSGMAMAFATALDSLHISGLLGCVAGDDTIICVVKTKDDVSKVMQDLFAIVK